MSLIFRQPNLWLPDYSPALVRGPFGGLLRKPSSAALAKGTGCCCGVSEDDCIVFRGNAHSDDVHTHYPYITARFPAWGDAGTYFLEAASTDNECCATLDADYELLIRDYDTADTVAFGYFGTQPGMFMPTCMPCYDCDTEESHTWAFLRAFCNACDIPVEDQVPPCRSWVGEIPEGHEVVWTVELEIYGYWNTVCGTPGACSLPFGLYPKALMIWIKTALAGTHNYAGLHELTLVQHLGPDAGGGENYKDYYCQPPTTMYLYCGEDPPP